MAQQTGRLIGRISSFVAAGGLFAAGLIVGLIPYSESGYSLCPSAIVSMTGGTTTGQSMVNFFSGGRCTSYANTMTIIMVILMILAGIALVAAILLRKRRLAAAAGGYPNQYSTFAAPAQPDYAPGATEAGDPSPYAGSGYPAAADGAPAAAYRTAVTGQGSGTFDTKLLLVGLAAVAGIVLVSFLVDWLSFLPGILELLLWTAVGLTAIWQIKRRTAGTDEGKLAAAEAWNPAVVSRGIVAAGRRQLETHRAQRREAERTQAAAAVPEFRGDDGMVRPDGS
ncbi:hypothetical protein [Arthrobacter sp. UYCo732]|uniref:hypothetical protein n=1 Tax=Arthrobacter sp. UYCo732 TaxID=3156336 RepID=UPI0033977D53